MTLPIAIVLVAIIASLTAFGVVLLSEWLYERSKDRNRGRFR